MAEKHGPSELRNMRRQVVLAAIVAIALGALWLIFGFIVRRAPHRATSGSEAPARASDQ